MPRTTAPFRYGTAAIVAILALIAGMLQLRRGSTPPAARQVMPPGTAWAVPVAGGHALLDLPSTGGQRYLLLVNSLEEASVIQRVRLRAMPAGPRETPVRLQPVRPLREPPAPVRSAPRNTATVPPGSRSRSPALPVHVDGTVQPPPQGRDFWLHVTDGDPADPRQYTQVQGQLVGHGRRVQVYLDRQLGPADLANGLVEEIVTRFDSEVVPQVCGLLGSWNDVDDDHRFTVLLSPWLGKLQGGQTSVGGFVRQADFSRTAARPLCNRCDMMYLNTSLQPGTHLQTLLLHEFTHAVCFSQRGAGRPSGPQLPREEDWLNEAIAHSVETRFGGWSNLDYRISRYLNDTTRYPLIVPDYYSAGLWRNHGCRGATWLFLHWLEARFGPPVLPQIVREPAAGTVGLERVLGLRFPALYRHFTLALAGVNPEVSPPPAASIENAASGGAGRELRAFPRLPRTIGQWVMAGPRPHAWQPARQPELTLELTGTSTAHIVIETASPEELPAIRAAAAGLSAISGENSVTPPPAWRIEVEGSTPRLQVTVVALHALPQNLMLQALATTEPSRAVALESAGNSQAGHVMSASLASAGTVVRADYTRLENLSPQLTASESHRDSATRIRSSTSGISPGEAEILVCIEAEPGSPPQTATSSARWEVVMLSCELHDGDTRRSVCLQGEALHLARFHTQSKTTADNRLWFRLPFPATGRRPQLLDAANGPDPVVKAIVRDSAGQQQVLWTTARRPAVRTAGGPGSSR